MFRKVRARLHAKRVVWNGENARRQWLLNCKIRGCFIENPLHLTGTLKPYSQIHIGHGCHLEPEIVLWISPDEGANARLNVGNRVFIGRGVHIGTYQPISIGDNTMIGAYAYIISGNHGYARRDIPMRDQGFTGAPILIGADVWIGTHATILSGVSIGQGAIVGAGSVVTKNISEFEIWGGVPAKFIKLRP